MEAIEVTQLSKRYRVYREKRSMIRRLLRANRAPLWQDVWALRDVSFAVSGGETVGVIGRNGSGKTTLLKLLAGVTIPDQGRVTLPSRTSALLELGTGFENDLTGRENIFLCGTLLGLSRRQVAERFDRIVEFSGIRGAIDSPIHTYSTGMWMRLGFSMAIHAEFDTLLIDEVLAVGDMAFQERCFERFRDLKARGVTILFVSHNLQQIANVCNRTIWLEDGRIKMFDRSEAVTMAYAGAVLEETAAEAGSKSAPSWERRWGTQDVVIRRVACEHPSGAIGTPFVTGEPMDLVLSYDAKRPIRNPVFGFGIHRIDGVHICGPNTKAYAFPIASIDGSGEVRFRMPSCELLQGQYRLSAAVYDSEIRHAFDHHEQLYRFDVHSRSAEEQYGLIKAQGMWQHAAQRAVSSAASKSRGSADSAVHNKA